MNTKSLLDSFRFAWHGLRDAWLSERNMRVHVTAAFLVLYGAYLLELNRSEIVALSLVSGMVIVAEMANTALEALIDLVIKKRDPLAKTAKNASAGAVLVTSLTAVLIGAAVFGQRLIHWRAQLEVLRAKPGQVLIGIIVLVCILVPSLTTPLEKKNRR